MGVPLGGRWQNAESYSLEYSMENRIAKAKFAVWLAIEEGVFSVELRLYMKRYSWHKSRAKFLKNVDAILSYFSFEFTEKFQSSLCSEENFVQW